MSSNHPLPARPSAITQAQGTRLPVTINLARSPYLSTPQPASPSFRANSPRISISSDSVIADIIPATQRLHGTALRVDNHLIQFGEEWEIHYRCWQSTEALPQQHWKHTAPSTSANFDSTNSAKRSRSLAFDPINARSSPGIASTSASTFSNSIRLQSKLDQLEMTMDPIEVAKATALSTTASLGAELRLFSYVDIEKEDSKGKGKEVESGNISRELWIFAVVQKDSMDLEEEKAVDKVLAAFEFKDLKHTTSGQFSYSDLIPNLPKDSDSASQESFSALALSEIITTTLQAIYTTFLAAAKQSLVSIISKSDSTIRLADSIIFLPPPTTKFGSPGARESCLSSKLSFNLILQRNGLRLQPIISDEQLKRFPASPTLIPGRTPITLAPYGLEAIYLRPYEALSTVDGKLKSKREGELELRLRARWNQALTSIGLNLVTEEEWIVCNLEDGVEGIELVWPKSLCLLDGSRPQPQSSPKRLDSADLTLAPPPIDIDHFRTGRRRLADDIRRQVNVESYQESLSQHGERISQMIIEAVKLKAKQANEAEAVAVKPSTTLDNPILCLPFTSNLQQTNGSPNLKIPVSLGGSVDIPSPIDHFVDRLGIPIVDTPQAPDLSEVYPSPPNKIEEKVVEKDKVDAFGDLDWGDDFGGGGGALPGEFDDGMMMGLTDDDFSFFDDPRPIVPPPASAGPSPAFVDHFSHLSSTPFNTLASPSPFRPSPQLGHQSSPGPGFNFDTPGFGNSLGLGVATILEVPDYSPRIEYRAVPVNSPRDRFGAISFGTSHSMGDCKYESRKGKFGIPTPEDGETEESRMMNDLKRLEGSKTSWSTSIYDPRIGKANRLKVKRRSVSDAKKSTTSSRWIDNKMNSDDDSDESEDSMDEDISSFELTEAIHTSDMSEFIPLPSGSSLLLFRHRVDLIKSQAPNLSGLPSTTVLVHNRELVASTLIDQIVHNPDYRERFENNFAFELLTNTAVSAHAIKTANDSLSTAFSSTLSPLIKQTDPLLLVRHQQSNLEVSPAVTNFWKPMALEPLSGAKSVTAFIVFEDGGPQMRQVVKDWLTKIGDTYQNLRLGSHTPGSVGTFVEGMMQVASGSFQQTSNTFLKHIYGNIEQASRSSKRIVVYILDPSGKLPCTTASPITIAVRNLSKIDCNGTASVAIFTVPVSSLFQGSTLSTSINRLAFAVYDRLFMAIPKLVSHAAEPFPKLAPTPMARYFRMFQSPVLTISSSQPKSLEFHLQWPAPTLQIQQRHRFLQVAYSVTSSGFDELLEWVVVTAIDETGENWKSSTKLLISMGEEREVTRAKQVWSIAKSFAEEADVEWRIIIGSVEVMTLPELKAWDALLQDEVAKWNRPANVTVLSLDLAPSISILHIDSAEELDQPVVKPHLDTHAIVYAYTPTEPIILNTLVVPFSTYLVHIPRIASISRTAPTSISSPAISIIGIHLLASFKTPTSTNSIKFDQQLQGIAQNLIELAVLAKERNGASGRLPIHVSWLAFLKPALVGI